MFGTRKFFSAMLVVSVFISFSLTATAFDRRLAGEITVSGAVDGVKVNGSVARSGRAIANGSTITTGKNSSATITVDGVGTIRLAPGSTFAVNFDASKIEGNLVSGEIKVLDSMRNVEVSVGGGDPIALASGEAVASSDGSKSHDDGSGSSFSNYWWVGLLIVGGAVGVVLATSGGDDTPNVSPNR